MKPATLATALATLLIILTPETAQGQEAPFIGVVTQKEVDIRSGTSKAYYAVGSLKKGDMVRVEKILFNQTWYQIRVPKGVYSYVAKVFVNAQGDGKTGTINADRTAYKAASLRGPGESYREQGLLNKDDTVTILAEEGNYYKIESPEDTFVFIPAGTLREATAEDLEAATDGPEGSDESGSTDEPKTTPESTNAPEATNEPETPVEPVDPVDPVQPFEQADPTQPVTPASTEGPEATNEPETPVGPEPSGKPLSPTPPSTDGWPAAPKVEVETPARSESLKTLEMKVLPYFSLPIEQQPLGKMAEAYQNIQAYELPKIDEQIVEVRLRVIERRQNIVNTMEQAKSAQKATQARTVITKKEDLQPLPERYTAVGTLVPSTVYDGGSLPLLYRIIDASTSARTLAYVAPSEELDPAAMLYQLVGIVGDTNYDRTLKLNIITIKRAVMLEPEADEAPQEQAQGDAEDATE